VQLAQPEGQAAVAVEIPRMVLEPAQLARAMPAARRPILVVLETEGAEAVQAVLAAVPAAAALAAALAALAVRLCRQFPRGARCHRCSLHAPLELVELLPAAAVAVAGPLPLQHRVEAAALALG